MGRYKFKIHMKGAGISEDHTVKVKILTKYLSSLNNLAQHVTKFRKLVPTHLTSEDFEMYFEKIEPGSAVAQCVIPAYDPQKTLLEPDTTDPQKAIGPNAIEQAENEINEVISQTQNDNSYSYFTEKYQNTDDRVQILKDLEEFLPDASNEIKIIIEDKKKKFPSKMASFGSETRKRIKVMMEKEKSPTPKLVGEYHGFNAKTKSPSIFMTLLNGEYTKCKYDEEDYQKYIESNLKNHDIIEIDGSYSKPLGKNTDAKITNIKKIHKLKDEFILEFEEYKEKVGTGLDLSDPTVIEELKYAYQVLKENYAILKVLGDDSISEITY